MLKELYKHLDKRSNRELARIFFIKTISKRCIIKNIDYSDMNISSDFVRVDFDINDIKCHLTMGFDEVYIYADRNKFSNEEINEFMFCDDLLYINLFEKKIMELLDDIEIYHKRYLEKINNKNIIDETNRKCLINKILEE